MKNDGANPPGQDEILGLIDLNCHILPGFKDGPRNITEAIEMLKIAYEEGIRTIVATPSYDKENQVTDDDKLDRLLEQLGREAEIIDPSFKLFLGREIAYSGESHEKIISGKIDSMADSKYVMLRFEYDAPFDVLAEAIRDINMDEYVPILTDTECYECLEESVEKVEEVIQLGAYIMIDAAAVTGDMGHDKKVFVKKLLKEELVHFVSSGASNPDDKAPYLKEAADYIERKYGEDYKQELFYNNPKAVIENDDVYI